MTDMFVSRLITAGFTSITIVAAAVVWLTACSGTVASNPDAASSPTTTPYSPTVKDQPKGAATAVTGEGSRGGPSPAAATADGKQPHALTVSDKGPGWNHC